MNKSESRKGLLIISIILAGFFYCLHYFNYFEMPTADFIGNIKPRIDEYSKGGFPGTYFKFLPLYPLILTFLSSFASSSNDPAYTAAIIFNISLFVPYIILVYLIFKEFLNEKTAAGALLFLCVNIYTVYTAVNSELEMLLSLLIVLSILLSLKENKLSYAVASLVSITKWDSVFIIPAVMASDFIIRKKKLLAVLLGTLASLFLVSWFLLSIINTPEYGNPYVAEIVRRGPILFKYLLDCFLILSGFTAWMGMDAFSWNNNPATAVAFVFLFVYSLFIIINLIWGIIIFIKRTGLKKTLPVMIFMSGFLLLHMIYQNSKERYVLPVLWLLVLFTFKGLSEGFIPTVMNLKKRIKFNSHKIFGNTALFIFIISFFLSLLLLILNNSMSILPFFLIFMSLFAAFYAIHENKKSNPAAAVVFLIAGIFIILSLHYGIKTMDHYRLRRIEFKQAALWYKENAENNDKLLISELNVPKYYTGFPVSKFVSSSTLTSVDFNGLIEELKRKKITYVFIDDFYIRRLKVKDKNAIEKKAQLLKLIRDKAPGSRHFRLIKSFESGNDIKSYLYKLMP